MTVNEAIFEGKTILKKNNIEEAEIISKIFLSYTLKIKKEQLIINYDKQIKEELKKQFFNGIEKIANRISNSIHNQK